MKSKVQKWGNSLALRIPKPVADDLGLAQDSIVELTMTKKTLVVVPAAKPTLRLADLLQRVAPGEHPRRNRFRITERARGVVTSRAYTPGPGDIIWLTLTPVSGHEQAGRRPVLVLSPAAYNAKVGLALCCPITSQVKGYPFEVELPVGLPVRGAVLSDQVRSLDWRARHAELACRAPSSLLPDVMSRLVVLLPLPATEGVRS